MRTLAECEPEYGSVDWNGTKLTITQLPYIHHYVGLCSLDPPIYYLASAQDDQGFEYEIAWPCINPDCEDESDACDWNDFEVDMM